MALPIRLESSPRPADAELRRRLHEAPAEHADALLAVYDLLQALDDREILDALKGALSSSDFILEAVVETANTPQTVRLIRNLLLLAKMVGDIEPELVNRIAAAVPEGLAQATKTEPPGLFTLLQKFNSPDCRRGMHLPPLCLRAWGNDWWRRRVSGTCCGWRLCRGA
jgi:uncharacterized protein YjgD (DUF1641 family)